ncbi:MAG: TRAP transporter large permease subunit [Succinatimonas sp.]|nr:TRAP transporter large permease subunit [Succinatimonas sp.]
MALFVAARVGNCKLEVVLRGIIPFILIMVSCLMVLTFIPEISMFIPNLLK